MNMCIMLLQRNYMNESPEQNNNDPKNEQDQIDLELTAEEEELLKKKLEELRKMDPFIYR
jgi:RNA polymerase-binding transcription factor DksA